MSVLVNFSVTYILFQVTGNGRFGLTVPILLLKGSVSTFLYVIFHVHKTIILK